MVFRQNHILFPFLVLLAPGLQAVEQADSSALKRALWHKKTALEAEFRLTQADLKTYYLVIDLPAKKVDLKAGARLLRTCPIQSYGFVPRAYRETLLLKLVNRIDPFTPEPGNHGLRHRGRRFPQDFIGRLIEGPRETSRLYFSPSLLVQPVGLPPTRHMNHLNLNGDDIKALGTALRAGSAAILIPPSEIRVSR